MHFHPLIVNILLMIGAIKQGVFMSKIGSINKIKLIKMLFY